MQRSSLRFLFVAMTAACLFLAVSPRLEAQPAPPAGAAADASVKQRYPAAVEVEPAVLARLGTQASPSRAEALARVFLAIDRDASVLGSLTESREGERLRYEGRGLDVDVALPARPVLRVRNASVTIEPTPDGSGFGFEISAPAFGASSRVQASGTLVWGAGPAGGDRLDITFAIDGGEVDVLRTVFPERFHESVGGVLDLSGSASGIVGEVTSEEMPATPLRGKFVAKVGWKLLNRDGPLSAAGEFSMDDRSVRLLRTRLEWEGLGLDVQGWFEPSAIGSFHLFGRFADVDVEAVATDWKVPAPWSPQGLLTGRIDWKGSRGDSQLRYEATAPRLVLPALGGYRVEMTEPKFVGALAAINAEVSASIRSRQWRIGEMDLGDLPVGIRWWREKLTVSASNTKRWGAAVTAHASYEPALHPAFRVGVHLANLIAEDAAAELWPAVLWNPRGTADVSLRTGLNEKGEPELAARASLRRGAFGEVSMLELALAALGRLDPALVLDAETGALPPQPEDGGTPVEVIFAEMEERDGVRELGGIFLQSAGYQFDGDGSMTADGGLDVRGTLALPTPVIATLVARAPWVSALRNEGGGLFLPLVVKGTLGRPEVELAGDYAALVSEARAGRPVTAPRVHEVRHVAMDGLSPVVGDPSRSEFQ